MNLWPFGRRPEARALTAESPAVPLTQGWIFQPWNADYAAPVITPEMMGRAMPVRCAVTIIADTIATMPFHLYRKEGSNKARVDTGDLAAVLRRPNADMTSVGLRRRMMRDVLYRGDAFLRVEMKGNGRPAAVYPLVWDRVQVERVNGKRVYRYALADGGRESYGSDEIIHIMWDPDEIGLRSRRPFEQLAPAIGVILSAQSYAQRFFDNDARPGLAITTGAKMSDEAKDRRRSWWRDAFGGGRRGVAVLDAGEDIKTISGSNDDAQYIEQRRFAVEEIGRGYNIPPVFLQDYSNAPFKSAEHQDLIYAKHTILSWCRQIEEEFDAKLTPSASLSIHFDFTELERGDFKTRMDGLARAVQGAIYTPDEARAREHLPAVPGGDRLYLQQNMADLAALNETPPAEDAVGDTQNTDGGEL